MNRAVMILAGGTGGHVYPGLAVAEALRAEGCELFWMGTRRGIESRVVPAAGLPLLLVPVAGLRRSGAWRWLTAPVTVGSALLCALVHMIRIRPRVVLGMGGFVSGPGGVAAWLCRRPLVIHEQNAIPGLTNRLLARIASRVCEAFPGTFAAARSARTCGNPVRQDIAALAPPAQRLGGRETPSVLVFGGSRGARALNETVPAALASSGMTGLRVLHQCGEVDVAATRARYAALAGRADVEVTPYIDDMAGAYAMADLVIARAGALTVAELAASGVASILVPYPHAVDDHQTANARYLVDAGAALLVPERELDAARLGAEIARLLCDRTRLLDMAERAHALARPDAVTLVARSCLEYVDAD